MRKPIERRTLLFFRVDGESFNVAFQHSAEYLVYTINRRIEDAIELGLFIPASDQPGVPVTYLSAKTLGGFLMALEQEITDEPAPARILRPDQDVPMGVIG